MAVPNNIPRSVIIVGGSLAGLMHALTLLSLPHPPTVRILERSPTALLHDQGAGVVAGNETQRFFAEYVRPGREIAVVSPLRHYLNRKGEVMPETINHLEQRMTSWDLLYHLLRWRVDGTPSEHVKGLHDDDRPKARYENGCTVTDVSKVDEQVQVRWTRHDRSEDSAKADLVIAADGASSTVRKLFEPGVERTYAGYVAWRGTVPEEELSEQAKKVFVERFTFYHTQGIQILGYVIPGPGGTLERGRRLFNWVWYCNYPEGSAELEELMTGMDGKRHAVTLPVGTIKPHVWQQQQEYATKTLPPQFAEAVQKTQQPFIQAITDVVSTTNRPVPSVLFVGDALAGFRPHTAASTSQAAYDALMLGQLMIGEISGADYDEAVMSFARSVQQHGVQLGERSQFGRHPFDG